MISNLNEMNSLSLANEIEEIAARLNVEEIGQALFFPKYFQIETVRLCNSRCPYCACDQWDKSVPFMPEGLFEKIVEELESYSKWIEWVCLSRAGEPLLDKRIAWRVRMLKSAGIKRVNITTNASLLDNDKTDELLRAGLDEIMLSIDSIEKDEYEQRKVGLEFETVLQNIRSFFQLRDKIRPDMIVRVRAVSFYDIENASDREKFSRWEGFWNELKKPQDRIYMKKPHNWGNQKSWEGHTPEYGMVYHPCILPWSTLHITSMGKVTICPMDYDADMDLGNINEQSIKDVWKGQKIGVIRSLHENGRRNELRFCQGCRLFDQESRLEQ